MGMFFLNVICCDMVRLENVTLQPPPMHTALIVFSSKWKVANIKISRVRFGCVSVAHLAYMVNSFRHLIETLHITFETDTKPAIKSLEEFDTWLSNIPNWGRENEFEYIAEVKDKIKSRSKKNNNG